MSFKVGDRVVYPHHGAAVIDRKETLEVGGEKYQMRQVLGALFVAPPGEGLEELRLSPRALVPGVGVPVVAVSAVRPVAGPGMRGEA